LQDKFGHVIYTVKEKTTKRQKGQERRKMKEPWF